MPRLPKPVCLSCYSTSTKPPAASRIPQKFSSELLARPEVLGVKIATLDRVMTFQDIVRLVHEQAPSKLIITGEDRFLGYSLMCGAQAALIGMGAACTGLQAEMLDSYWTGQADRFLALNAAVDDLAQHHVYCPDGGVHSAHALVPRPPGNHPGRGRL